MTTSELNAELEKLLALPAETEWIEFKEAKNDFHFDNIGKYFSALSNEANLKNQPYGWLIFGVKDNPREVVGTNYRPQPPSLDKLKMEVASLTNNGITFMEIHELHTPKGRVIMFNVSSSPCSSGHSDIMEQTLVRSPW